MSSGYYRFIFIISNACLYRITIYVQTLLHHPECVHLLSDPLSLSLNNYGASSNISHDNGSHHLCFRFLYELLVRQGHPNHGLKMH